MKLTTSRFRRIGIVDNETTLPSAPSIAKARSEVTSFCAASTAFLGS